MSYYFAIIGTKDNPLFEYEFGTSKQGGDGQPRFSDQARHLNQFIMHSSIDIVEEVQWTNGQLYFSLVLPLSPFPFPVYYLHVMPSPASPTLSLDALLRSLYFLTLPTTLPTHASSSLTQTKSKRYLKHIDKVFNNYISCFMTGGNVKFLLLHQPTGSGPPSALGSSASAVTTTSSSSSTRSSTSIGANPTSPQTEEAIKNFMTEVYDNYVKAVMSPFYKVNMEIKSPVFRQRVAAAGRKYL